MSQLAEQSIITDESDRVELILTEGERERETERGRGKEGERKEKRVEEGKILLNRMQP